MTYYIKGGSVYNAANPKVWVSLFLGGYSDALYDTTWNSLTDKGVETNKDPYWRLGSSSGGAQTAEFGLLNDYRIEIDQANGVRAWNGSGWVNLLAVAGTPDLNDLGDVIISGTPANNELLAWDTSSSKWINQTAAEAGLATAGHGHGQLHDQNHDNTYHSTNYHTESDGTGAVTVHSGISDAGSGIIISDGERSNLHTIYSLEAHDLATTGVHQNTLPLTDLGNYTRGSLIIGGTSDWVELVKGTTNYALVSNATDVAWAQYDYTWLANIPSTFSPSSHTLNSHTNPTGNIAMNSKKFTGLAAGTTNGDSVRYEQLHDIYTLETHADSHENTGGDEINVGGLSGVLADAQTPISHNNTYHSVTFVNAAGAVSAVEAAGLTLASTKVINSADEDLIFTFGRVKVGFPGGTADNVYFAHRDVFTTSNYALRQSNAGRTFLNAVLGDYIYFRINNANKMYLGGTALTMSVPIAMGSNKITGLTAGSASGEAVEFDQLHAESHTIVSHNDTTATGANLNTLVGSGDTTLHKHDGQYYTETEIDASVFEQAEAFPGPGSEGDLFYSEALDSLYRYNAEAQAWVEVGVSGTGSNGALTLEQARTNSNQISGQIDMNQNLIVDLPMPSADTDVSNRKHASHGTASNDLIFSNDTERSSANPPMTKIKEITIYRSANLRVYWEHKGEDAGLTICYSRVYVNGVAVGSLHENLTTNYVAFTEDITVNSGDTIEIWAQAFTDVPQTVWVRYQRLKFIIYVSTAGK